MDELSSLAKGRITELQVLTFFLKRGYIVSTPEIPCRYDFLLDIGSRILKIQVKTCREVCDGACIEFNTSSLTHNSKGYEKRIYSCNDVDYFCTYYNDNCYLVPFSSCGTKAKTLRFLPPKNSNVVNISFAKDYLADKILNDLTC